MNEFDYIVVGAGSAGAVLAARLTEDPNKRVLLLEAGRASHLYSRFPISFGLLINHPTANWRYESEPEEGTAKRAIPVPRGKLLGGSSAINGLVWVRGQPEDYDTWASMGAHGWSWKDVAPLFDRMEDFERRGVAGRGSGGPIPISIVPDQNPLYDALFKAAGEVGYKTTADYNGIDQEGIGKTQANILRGRRMSVADCYLKPAMQRPNLTVLTEASVRRVLLEGKRCVGVVYTHGGKDITARAGKEVILSAGAVATPQLLELSGIGNPEVLQAHGIAVKHALPAVGENLRDHIAARVIWRVNVPEVSYNHRARGFGAVKEVLRYLFTRGGFFSLPSAPMLAFLKSRPDLATPDVQFHLVPYSVKDPKRRKLQEFPSMVIIAYQLRPESLGSIHIRSANPNVAPAIRFNFLDAEIDRRTLVEGFRMARRVGRAPALQGLRGEEFSPGEQIETDEQILEWIRNNSQTTYHPIGTCRMGKGPDTVVDEHLRVHGIDGLRVADASVFPTMPSGNTNAPAIMVGEKAADILRSWGV